jgi:uncharacterized protein YjiS (DUF1127 family)
MFASANASPVDPGHPIRDCLRSYFAALYRHSLDKRSVNQLQDLDDRMLRDIGVTREQALRARPRPLRHFVSSSGQAAQFRMPRMTAPAKPVRPV